MITSVQNPRIKQVRALLHQRQERKERALCIIEGVRLIEEALLAGWKPDFLLFSQQLSPRGRSLLHAFAAQGAEVEEIDSRLMKSLADTENPQGLLGVFPVTPTPLPPPPLMQFLLVLDQVRDPGNMGTLLRTAAAAGVQAVLLTPGSAEAYSPKVLRAGMGAQFRLPVHRMDFAAIQALYSPTLQFWLAEAARGTPCWRADLLPPLALVIGGEADGASPEARSACPHTITIPMPGESESLNAAIAAAILMFEVVRQRKTA